MIEHPIFVVGSGRSGTTLIYNLLAVHREFAWFSNWTNRFPQFPQLAVLSRWNNWALLGKYRPAPAIESNGIYRYCGIHSIMYEKQRALRMEDVPMSATKCLISIIEQHLHYQRKSRFLHKNTNNSMRILYLKETFPTARFIHVVRDPQAVVQSLLHVSFWPDLRLWWTDQTPREWENSGSDPVLLAALHWQQQVAQIAEAQRTLRSEDFVTVRYEDFVANPSPVLKTMSDFADLAWTSEVEEAVAKKQISNLNDRWRNTVNRSALAGAWEHISGTAALFGYV